MADVTLRCFANARGSRRDEGHYLEQSREIARIILIFNEDARFDCSRVN
jgi:hypothetical protein